MCVRGYIVLCLPYVGRKSASCTHVSAVLHALAALTPASFQLRATLPCANDSDDEESTPVTSLPCQWKPPKKRKESTLPKRLKSMITLDL